MNFQCWIGIDQTGAIDSKNRPKPLYAAVFWRKKSKAFLKITFLQAWSEQALGLLLTNTPYALDSQTAIFLDAVLGLPKALQIPQKTLLEVFKAAAVFPAEKPFGNATSQAFFHSLEGSVDSKRLCETLSGSNSVFQVHPAQKNIACGTFRIWKEFGLALLKDPTPFVRSPLWDLQSVKGPYVFEIYPSLCWHQLGFRTRKIIMESELKKILQKTDPTLQELHLESGDPNYLFNPNFLDAVISAIFGWKLSYQGDPFLNWVKQKPWFQQEGWILGVHEKPLKGLFLKNLA